MPKFRALAAALAILIAMPMSARAISLSLNGDSADLRNDNTQAVYASDSNGSPVLITAVGMRASTAGRKPGSDR